MKTKLLLLALAFGLTAQAQTYQFSLVQNSGYNYSVVATPDFTQASPLPIINQMNFTIMIPDGVTISTVTGLPGSYDQPLYTALDTADSVTGRDAYVISNATENLLPAHTAGTPIVIGTFDVNGTPTTGSITLLDNASQLALTLTGGEFNSFFIGITSGLNVDSAIEGYVGQLGTVSYSFATLGVEQNELTGYSIFPNPATDVVNIKGLENTLSKVEVFNIAGQRVFTSTTNMQTIDVSAYNAGVYFVKLSTEDASLTTKLIKQ